METEFVNCSAENLYTVVNWLPSDLAADKVVFFPDACPSAAPLPTGVAVHIPRGEEWRKFALSDIGCGMLLLESDIPNSEVYHCEQWNKEWDGLGLILKENRNKLGDLGGGNHFLDAIVDYETDKLSFLIHTGSRHESNSLDNYLDNPKEFGLEYERVTKWAANNRAAIGEFTEKVFGKCRKILDTVHNSYEILSDDSVIIRKGVIRVNEGDLTVLPSSMNGDISLLRIKPSIKDVLNSISHGTGRTMSRSEAKKFAESLDFQKLRSGIYIPEYIQDTSLRTEGPHCYRDLNSCLELLKSYAEEARRYAVVAYLGSL